MDYGDNPDFDAFKHFYNLFHYRDTREHENLIRLLFKRMDGVIHFYLPQLCQLSIVRKGRSDFDTFILDKTALSMNLALKSYWIFTALHDPEENDAHIVEIATEMVDKIYMTAVNKSSQESVCAVLQDTNMLWLNKRIKYLKARNSFHDPTEFDLSPITEGKIDKMQGWFFPGYNNDIKVSDSSIPSIWSGGTPSYMNPFTIDHPQEIARMPESHMPYVVKKRRSDYFDKIEIFVQLLINLSSLMIKEEKQKRHEIATSLFIQLNHWMFCRRAIVAALESTFCMTGLALPCVRFGPDPEQYDHIGTDLPSQDRALIELFEIDGSPFPKTALQILRIVTTECKMLSSAKRAPYLLICEVADLDEDMTKLIDEDKGGDPKKSKGSVHDLYAWDCVLEDIKRRSLYIPRGYTKVVKYLEIQAALETKSGDLYQALIEDDDPLLAIRRSMVTPRTDDDSGGDVTSLQDTIHSKRVTEVSPPRPTPDFNSLSPKEARLFLWGETWSAKRERLRAQSPYARLDSWDVLGFLVKGGDDVRQEYLASQFVRIFSCMFKEANLPLWLRPYEILPTGADSGIIEFVPDTQSFGYLKQKSNHDNLAKVFEICFKDNLRQAQNNFIQSHAAYSLISYLMNVKDRHNGNLLLTTSGHCVHIDYGYMLNNSPGNISMMGPFFPFETSPFKLTQEIIDIMGGVDSDTFEYFKRLLVNGFIYVRNEADKIILLVEMMIEARYLPCFMGNPQQSIQCLKDRFMLKLSVDEAIDRIISYIDLSINNWRTIQYDNFQKLANKIW